MTQIRFPSFPLTGGCQCGAVRFELKAPPVVFYLCHCTTCQQQSASAFGQSVKVRTTDVTIRGELAVFHAPTNSGRPKLCEFCPTCGVRIAHGRRPGADTFNLKGGTFDDHSWLIPAGHIWTASKQPFVAIAADELHYPQQPPDYGALTAKWQKMIGG
jgi:hypothetical protein